MSALEVNAGLFVVVGLIFLLTLGVLVYLLSQGRNRRPPE